MTVQCPRCRTQYKIPSARINDPRPVFKCTRCSLVFSSEAERGPRGRAKEDKNLPLPFTKERPPAGKKAEPTRLAGEDDPTVTAELEELPDEADDATDADEEEVEEDGAEDEESDEEASEDDDGEEDSDDAPDDAEEEEDAEAPPARRRASRAAREPRARTARPAADDPAEEPAFVAKATRDRERERAIAERERAAAEREKAAAERERAAAARERERERERAAAERERAAAERERERERAAAERERLERERAARARKRARDEELRLRDEDDEDDVADLGPTSDLPDEDDDEPRRPVLSASEGKQRRAPINPRRIRSAAATGSGGRSPLRPVAIGVAAIAVVYLGLAVALSRRSEAAIETLSQVPVLGRLLGGDHLLVWRLQLTGVDGGLDQIKGGRPAYVVAGRAVNTTNEDLRVIEIEGRLLANGVEQRRQTVYAANQQRKTIQDLSPSEVEMLLKLEPNRRFVIRPGESASFLLVFPNPPPGTTEVTCRVINARAT
jgi:predicted Zn finger-like uncharacterized protein